MMQTIWLDAVDFDRYGQWRLETQFIREMAQPYLIASHTPGVPVEDAVTTFRVAESGYYKCLVRTKNWKYPEAPGRFHLTVDGTVLQHTCGKMPILYWYWDVAGEIYLEAGEHTLSVCDETGWLSRFAAVIVTNDNDFTPSPEPSVMMTQRARIKGISTETVDQGRWDLVVVGAGPGGFATAISAARQGLRVALISGRPTVGGNASDEGAVSMDGASALHDGYHETGIPHEIKRLREHKGITWQAAIETLVAAEPTLTVFTDELCIGATMDGDRIAAITCVQTKTLERHRFTAPLFVDGTGDGWLGYYAGAKYRVGRESRHEFHEAFAPDFPDALTMSGCNCDYSEEVGSYHGFYLHEGDSEAPFTPPSWAVKLPEGDALCRTPSKALTTEWWLENSNDYEDIYDSEFSRDELVRLAVGYFDWLKNSYRGRDAFKNRSLKHLALHQSKRENRRIVGDYILTQNDYVEGKTFPDAVSYTGWPIDIHNVKGIYSGAEGVSHENMPVPITPIPYRCLYSVNVENLFVASRCSSFTHVALGSVRVENTLATMGQAVGVAAALCRQYGVLPRAIYTDHIEELQQRLLKDDQTIFGVVNRDEKDLARQATVTATSENAAIGGFAVNVINGELRDRDGRCNAWVSDAAQGLPQSITLTLKAPTRVSEIHVTADTDLVYPHYSFQPHKAYGDTAVDFTVELLRETETLTVATVQDNCQRKTVCRFAPTEATAVRVTVTKTAGAPYAKLNEIRIYE